MADEPREEQSERPAWVQALRWLSGLLAVVVIYGSVCPLIRTDQWWIRIMDFPRVQLSVLGLLALAGLWLTRPPPRRPAWTAVMGLLVASLIAQGVRIFPFTPLAPHEVPDWAGDVPDDAARLKLLVANVEYDNKDASRLLALIEREAPDLVFLVETDQAWLDRLAGVAARYPHVLEHPRPKGKGLALYTRLPLEDAQVRHIVDPERPSVRADLVLASGERLAFWGLHPAPPGLKDGGDRKDSTPRDAELLHVAREVAALEKGRAAIVAGDFNDTAWSHTTRKFQHISGMLDPRVGRGMFNTYHAERPFLRYPIDHIFLTPGFALAELVRHESIGSDHFPMGVEVVWRGGPTP